jgi:hypothetical protein
MARCAVRAEAVLIPNAIWLASLRLIFFAARCFDFCLPLSLFISAFCFAFLLSVL